MSDLVKSLRALSRFEHDDYSIGDSAAERIEQLEAQLANARKDALEEVLIISAKVVQSHEKQMHGDETAFDEGYVLAIGQLQREILKLKEKP